MKQKTHTWSCGRLSVILPAASDPYLIYPKKPTTTYNITITVIPIFNTPQLPPKFCGVFILFSNAIICTKKYPIIRLFFSSDDFQLFRWFLDVPRQQLRERIMLFQNTVKNFARIQPFVVHWSRVDHRIRILIP